jgi:hypothetical protein
LETALGRLSVGLRLPDVVRPLSPQVAQRRPQGYRASEPMRIEQLSPGETQDLTVPLQHETISPQALP